MPLKRGFIMAFQLSINPPGHVLLLTSSRYFWRLLGGAVRIISARPNQR
jgi:hypothetical protein